jgi:LmbE family N-acetylglucosaminyl deacetylase
MEGSPDNQHPESLYAAPLNDVAMRIAGYMRRLRPDVVITHDQFGWYGHPDHIKCFQAVVRAYELLYGIRCGDTHPVHHAPRLYVSSFSKSLLKVMIRLMPLFGRNPRRHGQNRDVDLVEIASWNVRLTAKIKVGNYLSSKDRAKAAHASQQPLAQSKNRWVSALLRRTEAVESFSRLYPPVSQDEGVERSLFEVESPTEWKLATSEMLSLAS